MSEEINGTDLTADEKRLLDDLLSEDQNDQSETGNQRRTFLKQLLAGGGGAFALQLLGSEEISARAINEPPDQPYLSGIENSVPVVFKVNGIRRNLQVDSRMTLLDALRERLGLTGSKKGCDHGQCGACTVLADGKRVLSCLTLAASCEGRSVTTIEGLAKGGELHPMQAAFLKHDGFQCGYCTPGQICSAVALMREAKRGEASYLTHHLASSTGSILLSEEEIRERMSGNICRCGAYSNIVAAIREVHTGNDSAQAWRFVEEDGRTNGDLGITKIHP